MNNEDVAVIVQHAARIATSKAMNGHPVIVHWIPPALATQDWKGCFALEPDERKATDDPY